MPDILEIAETDGSRANDRAKRIAALEEALRPGQPLWAVEADEEDADALAQAEQLLGEVRPVSRPPAASHLSKLVLQDRCVCACIL